MSSLTLCLSPNTSAIFFMFYIQCGQLSIYVFIFLPFSHTSGLGTTWQCVLSCCDKDSAIIFTTGRLPLKPSLKLEWVLTTANSVGTNGLTCLPKHGGALNNKFWSPYAWPLRTLLSFRDRTPSALSKGPSSSVYNVLQDIILCLELLTHL
jgi:hypothetical protein